MKKMKNVALTSEEEKLISEFREKNGVVPVKEGKLKHDLYGLYSTIFVSDTVNFTKSEMNKEIKKFTKAFDLICKKNDRVECTIVNQTEYWSMPGSPEIQNESSEWAKKHVTNIKTILAKNEIIKIK